MAKVTSKLQVTIPKAIATAYGIRPGDDLQWVAAGESIRVIPPRDAGVARPQLSTEEALRLFDDSMRRQREREAKRQLRPSKDRGWTREELYEDRGRPR